MKSPHCPSLMNGARRAFVIFGLTLSLAALFAAPVRGQLSADRTAQSAYATFIAQEGDLASVLSGETIPPGLAAIQFETLTKEQWTQLRREQLEALRSEDESVWQAAAVHIMYLTSFHGEKVQFDRASLPLMERYVFERDEKSRVLALAAMHAIGHPDTMARLSQRVRTEGSLRVRRLTVAAVLDYFSSDPAPADNVPAPAEAIIASDQ